MVSASDNAFGFILNVPYTDHCMEPAPSADCLNEMLITASLSNLQITQYKQLNDYLSLILRWNTRTNLTSVRDPEAILSRHFVESIACAQALPPGINTLLDFGSGAGFPGIPIAICRPDLAVTLAESQGKKAAFLQEAVRTLDLPTEIWPTRVEAMSDNRTFEVVTLRAVDNMPSALAAAALRASRKLLILGTLHTPIPFPFTLESTLPLPNSTNSALIIASRI